jgi:hypothetical protein
MHRNLFIGASAVLCLFSATALAQPPAATGSKAKSKPAAARPLRGVPAPAAAEPTAAAAPAASDAEPDAVAPSDKPERRISIAAIAGVGINETKIKDEGGNETKEGVGTQGAGIGLRGGYTLPMKVYIGAAFVYHLGGSKDADQIKYTGSTLYLGPEVGYDLELGPIIVRPYVGLGYGSVKAKAEAGGTTLLDRSEGGFAAWPGVMARYPVDAFFVGADARYALVTGTDKITNGNGAGVFATVGMTF